MKKNFKHFTFSLCIFLSLNVVIFARLSVSEEESAVKILERLNDLRDYENGAEKASEMSQKFSENTTVRAWSIIFTARTGESKKAVELGEKLAAENPNDEFVLYALGNAYLLNSKLEKALEITEKTVQLAPQNQKIILLRVYSLMSKKRFAEALQLIDLKADLFTEKSLWHTAKAEIFYRQKEKEKSFAAFEQAIAANPNNVTANYAAGFYYNVEKKFDKSLPILKRAVEFSPQVIHIRRAYLDAHLQARPQDTSEKREATINAELESFMKAAGETPRNLLAVSAEYNRLEMSEKRKEFENRLLEKFPTTRESERILISRLRRFDANNELKRAEYIKKLREFIARPQHFTPKYLGEVYNNLLYNLAADKDFSDAEYLKLAAKAVEYEGLSFYDPYLVIARGLMERKLFAEAEKFANSGIEIFEKRVVEARKDEDYSDLNENSNRASILNISGEIFLRQKKYDAAEKVLLKSADTLKKRNRAFKLLGELYEETNRLELAEDAYISEIVFIEDNKLDFASLKNLYQKRRGNLDGFEKYSANIKKNSKAKLREFILAERSLESKNLKAFDLQTLDGKPLSFNDLKEKVVVINIWATWCIPCVREMPELQLLYKKYRKSKDVAVITINSEEAADLVKKFMVKGKYDFPVLLSSDYLADLKIDALPTTWFIDKQGKIVYTQLGYSKFLFEEFDWRIEELRK